MQKTLITLSAVALMATGALADPNPKQAKAFKSEVVRRFNACTSPNTKSSSLSLQACQPATLTETTCGFDNIAGKDVGKGVVSTTVSGSAASNNGDIKFTAALSGLNAGCEGHVLCPASSVRVTSTNGGCSTGTSCTLVDLSDFQFGFDDANALTLECCTVTSGKCKIKTTVNSDGGLGAGAVPSGKATTFELKGLSLRDVSIPGNKVAFVAGAFVP